jgi:hypothetical protein
MREIEVVEVTPDIFVKKSAYGLKKFPKMSPSPTFVKFN